MIKFLFLLWYKLCNKNILSFKVSRWLYSTTKFFSQSICYNAFLTLSFPPNYWRKIGLCNVKWRMDSIINTVQPFSKSLRLNVTNLGVGIEYIIFFLWKTFMSSWCYFSLVTSAKGKLLLTTGCHAYRLVRDTMYSHLHSSLLNWRWGVSRQNIGTPKEEPRDCKP